MRNAEIGMISTDAAKAVGGDEPADSPPEPPAPPVTRRKRVHREDRAPHPAPTAPRDPRRKKRRVVVLAVVLLVIALPAGWYAVTPRAQATLLLHYNESLLNTINIDGKLRNTGTGELSNLRVNISVLNPDDNREATAEEEAGSLPSFGQWVFHGLRFNGDQTAGYTLLVKVTFAGEGGGTVSRSVTLRTEEPFLNLKWEEVMQG